MMMKQVIVGKIPAPPDYITAGETDYFISRY